MIYSKKYFIIIKLLIVSSINLCAQSESNKIQIFTPNENLPSLLNKNTNKNLPLNLGIEKTNNEPNINMDISEQEKFINPSEYSPSSLNSKTGASHIMPDELKHDLYLGDF